MGGGGNRTYRNDRIRKFLNRKNEWNAQTWSRIEVSKMKVTVNKASDKRISEGCG